jgi:hypothetical protein
LVSLLLNNANDHPLTYSRKLQPQSNSGLEGYQARSAW